MGFLPADEMSARPMTTVFHHFARSTHASQVGFLDGPPSERLHAPLADYITARGGRILTEARAAARGVGRGGPGDRRAPGRWARAAAPAPMCWPRRCTARASCCPTACAAYPLFDNLWRLKSTPVMNVQLWFDGYIPDLVDNLYFTADAPFSVFADLAVVSPAGYDRHRRLAGQHVRGARRAALAASPTRRSPSCAARRWSGCGRRRRGSRCERPAWSASPTRSTARRPAATAGARPRPRPCPTCSWPATTPARITWRAWRARCAAASAPPRPSSRRQPGDRRRAASGRGTAARAGNKRGGSAWLLPNPVYGCGGIRRTPERQAYAKYANRSHDLAKERCHPERSEGSARRSDRLPQQQDPSLRSG